MKKIIILLMLSGCAYNGPKPYPIIGTNCMDVPKGTMIGDIEAPEHGYFIGDSISEAYLEQQRQNEPKI